MLPRPRQVVALVAALFAAILLIPGSPAAAATADRFGFAFVDNPTVPAWTALPGPYQYGSWAAGPVATGGKFALGRFLVKFPNIAAGARGNVHVTAVAGDGRFCETVRWYASGLDQIVDVQCFKAGGFQTDTPFTVLWTLSSGVVPAASTYASVQVSTPGAIIQQYNSTGGPVLVTPSPVGYYSIRFSGVGVAGVQAGNIQVTAVQPNAQSRRCKVVRWTTSGTDVVALVACFNPVTGALIDSDFVASFHRRRAVTATTPTYFGYVASPFTAQTNFNSLYGFGANSIGGMVIKYPDLHQKETHSQVTAYGDSSNYCGLEKLWTDAGGTALVSIACFTNAGVPVADRYLSTFTSRI
jgi:hypothetical protein